MNEKLDFQYNQSLKISHKHIPLKIYNAQTLHQGAKLGKYLKVSFYRSTELGTNEQMNLKTILLLITRTTINQKR